MKICYLNHDTSPYTGTGRFYNSFSEAVKKAVPGAEVEALTAENVLYPNKFKLLLALPAIGRILSRCGIIHALDGWPYGVIAAWANKTLKKPLIITAIGTGAVKPLYSWWRRPILKWVYRRADAVIAVSHNTKREILKFLPELKIDVINHGVDYEKFRNWEIKKLSNNAEQSSQFPVSSFSGLKPYILSVGAWKPRKGFDYSIKAFQTIKKKHPSLKYVILSNVSEKIKRQYPDIEFLSGLSEKEMIDLYKNAELFLLLPQDDNKDIEGFGLVFLEAAAAGLPVIGTKSSGAEDAVRARPFVIASEAKQSQKHQGKVATAPSEPRNDINAGNGFLVPPKDFQEAAAAMEKILSDQNLKNKMSEESLKFAKEMSWEKAANLYKEIYLTQIQE